MKAHQIGLSFLITMISVLASTRAEMLIHEQEAALPDHVSEPTSRSIIRGPIVKWVSPKNGMAVASPFELKVLVEPREGVKVDPSSLKVVYLKSPLVDLTPRLQTAIKQDGIEFKHAEAPPGLHTIRLTVKDLEGRVTNSQLTIKVNN